MQQINTVSNVLRPQRDVIASSGSGPNAIEILAVQPTAFEDIMKSSGPRPSANETLKVYAAAHKDISNIGSGQIEESPKDNNHQVRNQDVGNWERQGLRRLTLDSNEIDGDNRLPNFLLQSTTEERK